MSCNLCEIEVAKRPFIQSITRLGQGVDYMLFAYVCCVVLVALNGMMSRGHQEVWPTHNIEIFL